MENIQVKIFKRNEIDALLFMQTQDNKCEKQQATTLFEGDEQEMFNNCIEIMEDNQNEKVKKNQRVQLYMNPYQRRAHHRSETMLTQHVNFTAQDQISVKSRRPPSQLQHILSHPSKSIRDMYANLYTRTATSCASSRSQDNKNVQIKQVISQQNLKNQSIHHNNQLHLNGKFQSKSELATQLSNNKPSFIMQFMNQKPSTPQKYSSGVDSMKNRFRVFSEYTSSHHSSASNPKITLMPAPNIYSTTQSCITSQPSTPITISSKANIYFKNKLHNSNITIGNQKIQSEERQYVESSEMEEYEEKQLQNYILKGSLERLQVKINEQRDFMENVTENQDRISSSQYQQFNSSKQSILKRIMSSSQVEQGDNNNKQDDRIQAGSNNVVQINIINGSQNTQLSKKSNFTHFTVGKLQNISSGYSANQKTTTTIMEGCDANANNNYTSPTFSMNSNKDLKYSSTLSQNCLVSQEYPELVEQVQNQNNDDSDKNDKTPRNINDQVSVFSPRKISCYSDKYKGQRDLLMKNFLDHNNQKNTKDNSPEFLNSKKTPSDQPVPFLKRHFSVSGDVQVARKDSQQQQTQPTNACVKQTVETESDYDGYSSSHQLKQVFHANKTKQLNNIENCVRTSNSNSTRSNKLNDQAAIRFNSKSPKPQSGIPGFQTKSLWENIHGNEETMNPQKSSQKVDVNYQQQQNLFQQLNPAGWDGSIPSSPWEVNAEKGLIELTDSQAEQVKKLIKNQEINLHKRNTLEKVFGAAYLEKDKRLKDQNLLGDNCTNTGKIVSERSNSQGNQFSKTKLHEQLQLENIRRISSSQNLRSTRNINSQNQMTVNFSRKGQQIQSRKLLFTNPQKDIVEQNNVQKQQQLQLDNKSSQSTPIQNTKSTPQSQISLQQGLIRRQAQQLNAQKQQQQQMAQPKQQRNNNNLINQIKITKQISCPGEEVD